MKTHHVDTSRGTDTFGVDIHFPDDLDCVYDHRGLSHTVAVYIGLHELPYPKKREWKGRFHDLKCWPGSFEAIMHGEKTFEYRKNDRDFQVGDVLILHEFIPPSLCLGPKQSGYTGRILVVRVTYAVGLAQCDEIYGIPAGYCIMSVKKTSREWVYECANCFSLIPPFKRCPACGAESEALDLVRKFIERPTPPPGKEKPP